MEERGRAELAEPALAVHLATGEPMELRVERVEEGVRTGAALLRRGRNDGGGVHRSPSVVAWAGDVPA